jgi:hypothetical protein
MFYLSVRWYADLPGLLNQIDVSEPLFGLVLSGLLQRCTLCLMHIGTGSSMWVSRVVGMLGRPQRAAFHELDSTTMCANIPVLALAQMSRS